MGCDGMTYSTISLPDPRGCVRCWCSYVGGFFPSFFDFDIQFVLFLSHHPAHDVGQGGLSFCVRNLRLGGIF